MKKPILAAGLLAGLITTASAGDDLNSRFINAFNDTSGASETASLSIVAVVVPKPRLRPTHKPEPLTSDPIAKPQPASPPIPVARPANAP
jgi:hypothetical protein